MKNNVTRRLECRKMTMGYDFFLKKLVLWHLCKVLENYDDLKITRYYFTINQFEIRVRLATSITFDIITKYTYIQFFHPTRTHF